MKRLIRDDGVVFVWDEKLSKKKNFREFNDSNPQLEPKLEAPKPILVEPPSTDLQPEEHVQVPSLRGAMRKPRVKK